MLGSINTNSYEHESFVASTLNGQRSWVLQAKKVVAKIIKSETLNQRVESEKLRFRFTIYVNKHSQFNVMQDRLKFSGKWYMVVGDMLNGKWVLE